MNKSVVVGVGLTIIAVVTGVVGTYAFRTEHSDAVVTSERAHAVNDSSGIDAAPSSSAKKDPSEREALDAVIEEVVELSSSDSGKALGRLEVLFNAANEHPREFAEHAEYVANAVVAKADGRTSQFAQEYLILADLRDGVDDEELFVAIAKFARRYPNEHATVKLYQRVANDLVNNDEGQRALRLLDHGVKYCGSKSTSAVLAKHRTMTRQTISLLGRVNSGGTRSKRGVGISAADAPQIAGNPKYKKYVGKSPNIMGRTLQGRSVSRGDLQGNWVYVHFWATWCGACRSAVPSVVAMQRKYERQGVKFVGVNMDTDQDAAKEYMKSKKITWPQIAQDKGGWDSPLADSLGVSSIPVSVLISPSGKIVAADATGRLEKQIDAQLQFSKGLQSGLQEGLRKSLKNN